MICTTRNIWCSIWFFSTFHVISRNYFFYILLFGQCESWKCLYRTPLAGGRGVSSGGGRVHWGPSHPWYCIRRIPCYKGGWGSRLERGQCNWILGRCNSVPRECNWIPKMRNWIPEMPLNSRDAQLNTRILNWLPGVINWITAMHNWIPVMCVIEYQRCAIEFQLWYVNWMTAMRNWIPEFLTKLQVWSISAIEFQRCPIEIQRCPIKFQRCPIKFQRCPIKFQRCLFEFQRCPIVRRCSRWVLGRFKSEFQDVAGVH